MLAKGPDQRPLRFAATGSSVAYLGWMKLLQQDDTDEESTDLPKNPVPALQPKQILNVLQGEVLNQKTKPPGRFTKASLIKELERRGIGRPSTFSAIVKNITSKGLVVEEVQAGTRTAGRGYRRPAGRPIQLPRAGFHEHAGEGLGSNRPR
ncbi:DNA topoisomerase [Pseudomonas parakoreensis]